MLSADEYLQLQEDLPKAAPDAMAARLRALAERHADDARVWFLLGVAQHRLGQLDAALAAFDRTLELNPAHVPAVNAKGGLLAALGRLGDARDFLEHARSRFPSDPTLLVNLGYLREQDRSQWQVALDCYDAALALDPGHRAALMNRGYLLTLMKRLPEAIDNNRRLVLRYPEFAFGHFNLAETLLAAMRSDEALGACDRALSLDPSLAKAHRSRALALADLGRLEESRDAMLQAQALDPDSIAELAAVFEKNPSMPAPLPDPEAIYLHRGLRRFTVCDWSDRARFLVEFGTRVGRSLEAGRELRDASFAYYVQATPLPPDLHRRIVENFAAQFARRARTARPVPYSRNRREGQRIRVGYLSPDFREHLNARLTLPIYRMQDRSRFEVCCYSLHPDDGSDIRKQVAAAADRFVEASGMDSAEIADRIHADAVDILVDLAGITTFSRPDILAYRAAPVQVSYLGFPGTLGADYVQYRITDEVATPPAQKRYWRESLVYLPDTFYIYDASEPLPDVAVTREDYDLPDDAIVFCAFHNYYKIDPEIFDRWIRVLRRVPDSVLWLMGRDALASGNLRREAAIRGIDGGRLRFAGFDSRDRYRARFRLADLYLDTHCFTAMTTACDALWAGLPLITCPGAAFPSRVSASLLTAMRMSDCILPDLETYEERAVELARNPERLRALRRRVSENRDTTPLFDTAARVRQLEAALEEMWRRHLAGLPPESFAVKAAAAGDFRNRWH